MAMFRCVQVRSMDDAVNEIAYQTSVNIGGRVFSGILYDEGPEERYKIVNKGESCSGVVDEQHGSIHSRDSSDPSFPPPPYPFPLASFRPGMPYFPYPRS